jgi:hypothetical protein
MLRFVRGEVEQRPIAFQRSDDVEQCGEEERRGENAENAGEGPNKKRRMRVRRRLSLSMC